MNQGSGDAEKARADTARANADTARANAQAEQARAAAAQADASAREAEAEAGRQAAIAEQMRLEAQRRAGEEAIRTRAQEQIGRSLGRTLGYNEVAYNERAGAWILKEDLLEEQKAARINLAAAIGIPPFLLALKEDAVVNLGHNPSYSLSQDAGPAALPAVSL